VELDDFDKRPADAKALAKSSFIFFDSPTVENIDAGKGRSKIIGNALIELKRDENYRSVLSDQLKDELFRQLVQTC